MNRRAFITGFGVSLALTVTGIALWGALRAMGLSPEPGFLGWASLSGIIGIGAGLVAYDDVDRSGRS